MIKEDLMSAPVDVLAFSPHPDDAEIGCAGLLLLAARQGLRTAIVDLSEGERSTRGTPELRRGEKELAAERLHVAKRIGLGLPDTEIDTAPAHQAAVIACLRATRPRLVLAPYPEDRHPDHAAASQLIDRAVFFAGVASVGTGQPHRVERLLHYAIHQPIIPSLVFDVSSVWPEHQHALAAYQSQFSGDGPPTPLSGGGFLEVLHARARHYGAMINAEFGEPYQSSTPLFVDSPLSLLRPAEAATTYGSFR